MPLPGMARIDWKRAPQSELDLDPLCLRHGEDCVEDFRTVPRCVRGLVAELAVGPLDVYEQTRRSLPSAVRSEIDLLRRLQGAQPLPEAALRFFAPLTLRKPDSFSLTRMDPLEAQVAVLSAAADEG